MDEKIEKVWNNTGKVVGVIQGEKLMKRVDGAKHFLRVPPAIAWDAVIIERSNNRGVKLIMVIDKHDKKVYTTTMSKFMRYKFTLDRGFGKQYALALTHWLVNPDSKAAQEVQGELL